MAYPTGSETRPKYQPIPGYYDEAIAPSGQPRAHWRRLASAMARLGPDALGRRWNQGRQLIQSNGIAYNVYGDPRGNARPWPLDPVPFVFSEREWAGIEAAVVQRATLLNSLLTDFYGPQTILRDLRMPADLVFRNPSFLRACHGQVPPHGVHLFHYAADLARSPDGTWWVLADRTQAPSGAGYALENRLVCAQTLPEAFQQSRVRLLTRYFQSVRDGILSLARTHRDNPRVVLLTPGPYNETFFEHAYLARYLGYALVEGSDLTVRDGRVYLKTLGGLVPVDVILRRQDDEWCDPLELRTDSMLGVPGLVNVVRNGRVVVMNALGSGMLETPAHMAFLPGLCQHVLGEELKMPSVATWWCGEAGALRSVVDRLEKLVIKPAFPRFGLNPVFGGGLSATERQELADRMQSAPWQYVAQEQVALSTSPVWTDTGIVPRHAVVRVFASWANGTWSVLPGGLTRVSESAESLVVTMQKGGGSKDTWILSDHDEGPPSSYQPIRHPIDASRTADLPSRVADNLFWLGRYVERVEAQVRLARALAPALSGEADLGGSIAIESAVAILVSYAYLPEQVTRSQPPEQRRWLERTLSSMLFDVHRAGGLGWTAGQVRRIAWELKERLSNDTWRVLTQLDAEFQRSLRPSGDRLLGELDFLNRMVATLSAFSGLVMESMTRGHGWRFLDIGRRLERALQTLHLLRNTLTTGVHDQEPPLELLLHVADSSITYRTRYYTSLQVDLVLDLLLSDEANPRSVAFQISTLCSHSDALPLASRHATDCRLALKALAAIRLASPTELATSPVKLREVLSAVMSDLEALSYELSSRYLSHAIKPQILPSS